MSGPTLYGVATEAAAPACALLQAACEQRGVTWQPVRPEATLGPGMPPTPRPGDLLVLAGADEASVAAAEQLWRPGMRSLQGFGQPAPVVGAAALQDAGVRMPLRIAPAPHGRDALAAAARQLGAWPVLLRLPGGEGGRGVMRLDSLPSLVSVRDALPDDVALVEYVAHEVAWRVVIVGDEVVAAEAWRAADGEFRSNVGGHLECGRARPAEVDRMALAAARLLGLQFAGVDVMEAADGRVCVAEVNSPCYFVDTQRRSGVDIAGRIVDRLLSLPPSG